MLTIAQQIERSIKPQLERRLRREVEESVMRQGIQQGTQQGMQTRSLEIARNMLAKGLDTGFISEITDLSREALNNLH